jgi:uncharacterized protein (TIGR00369 family)
MTDDTNAPAAQRPRLQSDRAADGTSRANKYRQMIGYTTKVFEDRYGEVELVLRPEHMNSLGVVHGGVYMTLLDAAMGHACAWCAVPGNVRSALTVTLTTTFLATAKGQRLVGRARVLRVDGRMATLTGEVVDEDGAVCVAGQGSFMYLPGSENPEGLPRKAVKT